MPILANPMPISGQSLTSYVLNHRTSPLCGMVPSPLGGQIQDNRAIPILTNPLKCWPIHANPGHLEDKCASNLLNKLLYGLLVGLLGG